MHAEKRQYRRFRVDNKDISVKTLFTAETELLNIGVGGACLKTEQSLKSAGKQMIKLQSKKTPLTLPCSVVWEALIGNPEEAPEKNVPFYKTGVSFMGLLPNKLVGLKDFIRESGAPHELRVSDVHKQRILRFQVIANKKGIIYFTKTLPVRKIGLGGMLIEMDGKVQIGKIFPMELFIPNGGPPINFRGRIASGIPAPDRGPGRFDIGIEFLDIAIADKFRLSKFLLFAKIPGE